MKWVILLHNFVPLLTADIPVTKNIAFTFIDFICNLEACIRMYTTTSDTYVHVIYTTGQSPADASWCAV